MKPLASLQHALRRRSRNPGIAPGELTRLEPDAQVPSRVTVLVYDAERLSEFALEQPSDAAAVLQQPGIKWIDVDSIHGVGECAELCDKLGLHPLMVEDIINTDQRPKVEDYGELLFFVIKWFGFDADGQLVEEQISVALGNGVVLSFGTRASDVFSVVREYIRSGKKRVRLLHADYLAYRLLDSVVDNYYVVLDRISERIERLDTALWERPSPEILPELFRIKHDLLFLRKSIWPLRDALAVPLRDGSPLIRADMQPFFRDLYDHAVRVMDILETFREMQSGKFDLYMSSLSYRQNEVMKVLTVAAAIFLPLTFLAGIWGMNFRVMPELGWPFGYFIALGIMAAAAAGMIFFFKRKNWF